MHINKNKRGDGLTRNLVYNSEFPADAVAFITGIPLPLDGCGRFGGDVVDYAVDPLTLLMMSFDVGQELVGQVHPVGVMPSVEVTARRATQLS